MVKKWVVVFDHPYYPEVEEFDTEEDALKSRDEVYRDQHYEIGKYDSVIYVAEVISRVPLRTVS